MDAEIIAASALLLIIFGIFFLVCKKRNSRRKSGFYPYRKKYLLTKYEWLFYKKLKPLADRYGLSVIAKIRLADLVEVDTGKTSEFGKYFSKISSKHIDFGLVNPENMEVRYLIELDDSSHSRPDRIERDDFVNGLCEKTGYILIRTHGSISEVEQYLKNY